MIPTARRVQYAYGYLGLGLLAEAAHELDAVTEADQFAPEVMAARVDLFMAAHEWGRVVEYARRLLELDQNNVAAWISLGCAVRRVENVAAAKQVLLEAERLHGGQHAVIHYNLACYTCLLGEMTAAKAYLTCACRMDANFKAAALKDPDLAALADFVRELKVAV